MATLVTLKELQLLNWFFRKLILISLKLSLQQFSQALLFQNVWRKLLWKEQLCQLWQGLLPFYPLVGVVWRGTSYCRILAEEEEKELGSFNSLFVITGYGYITEVAASCQHFLYTSKRFFKNHSRISILHILHIKVLYSPFLFIYMFILNIISFYWQKNIIIQSCTVGGCNWLGLV